MTAPIMSTEMTSFKKNPTRNSSFTATRKKIMKNSTLNRFIRLFQNQDHNTPIETAALSRAVVSDRFGLTV